jgi:hypothetical protein
VLLRLLTVMLLMTLLLLLLLLLILVADTCPNLAHHDSCALFLLCHWQTVLQEIKRRSLIIGSPRSEKRSKKKGLAVPLSPDSVVPTGRDISHIYGSSDEECDSDEETCEVGNDSGC